MAQDLREFFTALQPLLTTSGGLQSADDAVEFLRMMKREEILAKQSIFLTVLAKTGAEEILQSFIKSGGWAVLNNWLESAKDQAKAAGDTAFLKLLLCVLERLPVSVSTLHQGSVGKIVRKLAKIPDESIAEQCRKLVDTWTNIITTSKLDAATVEAARRDSREKLVPPKRPRSNSDSSTNGHSKPATPVQITNPSPTPTLRPAAKKLTTTPTPNNKLSSNKSAATSKPLTKSVANKAGSSTSLLSSSSSFAHSKPGNPSKRARIDSSSAPRKLTIDTKAANTQRRGSADSTSPNKIVSVSSSGFASALLAAAPTTSAKKKTKPTKSKDPKPTTPESHDKKKSLRPEHMKHREEMGKMVVVEQPGSQSRRLALAMENKADTEPTFMNPTPMKKKSVHWAPPAELVSIKFIEKVSRASRSHEDFVAREHQELLKEREERERYRQSIRIQARIPWRRPPRLHVQSQRPVEITSGPEGQVQMERENSVLAATYFRESDIPPTPAEAPPTESLPEDPAPPPLIPLEEEEPYQPTQYTTDPTQSHNYNNNHKNHNNHHDADAALDLLQGVDFDQIKDALASVGATRRSDSHSHHQPPLQDQQYHHQADRGKHHSDYPDHSYGHAHQTPLLPLPKESVGRSGGGRSGGGGGGHWRGYHRQGF
eukprot:m.88632 g.88632  ORF g.88632 m.88632 type:complete len:656 (+) comp21465_c1_seq1:188-2155(+)